jgi:cytochrome o ubiquinol oxidase operon protein cyoD
MTRYVTGFALSIFLTLAAYLAVTNHWLSDWNLILAIAGLALIQLCVQLIFFLHLDTEERPHWNLVAVLSTAGVIFILVVGSLWIMSNLKYRHMTSEEIDAHVLENEGIQK